MSANITLASALEATKQGAADFILKPFEPGPVAEKVRLYGELFQGEEVPAGTGPIRRFEEFIFRSRAMGEVVEAARRVAQSDVPVLLVGERGVGKDLVARAMQSAGARAAGPFLRVDCSSEMPDFPPRDPAFTQGGLRRLCEATANGTLFLSEVGDLPHNLQESLTATLSACSPVHAGGARIIASSSHSLEELRARRLRPELFSRVAEVVIQVPPLRERPEDIAPLVRYFLARLSRRYNHAFALSWSAFDFLLRCSLPGNVRELECILERVAARTLQRPSRLTYGDLCPLLKEESLPPPKVILEEQPLNLNLVEQQAIERALWFAKGNRTRAAALLGIDRTTLHSKIRRLGKEPATN
jgi:DNA-binding NtrC family response regulator